MEAGKIMMTIQGIARYIHETYPEMQEKEYWDELVFFYNPEGKRKNGRYFVAFKDHDTENDKVSALSGTDRYRLSFKVLPARYQELFGGPSSDPMGSGMQFTAVDTLLPHPIYGPGWVSILSPSAETFEQRLKPLIAEAYQVCLAGGPVV